MKLNYTYKLHNSLISYISPKWTQSRIKHQSSPIVQGSCLGMRHPLAPASPLPTATWREESHATQPNTAQHNTAQHRKIYPGILPVEEG